MLMDKEEEVDFGEYSAIEGALWREKERARRIGRDYSCSRVNLCADGRRHLICP